jgi:hypothetical protein
LVLPWQNLKPRQGEQSGAFSKAASESHLRPNTKRAATPAIEKPRRSGASFSVSNGALSCAGSYNGLDTSPTISIPILCNDGRKGIVTATRNKSGEGGGGRFTLNDGATGDFIFGPAAAQL